MNKTLKFISLFLVIVLVAEIIYLFFLFPEGKYKEITLQSQQLNENSPETLINRAKDYVDSRITSAYLLIEIEGVVKKINFHNNQYGQYYHLVISDKEDTSEMALSLFKDQLDLTKISIKNETRITEGSINDIKVGDRILILSKENIENSKRMINEIILKR